MKWLMPGCRPRPLKAFLVGRFYLSFLIIVESFFTKLCSTPAKSPEMNLSSKYLSHQHDVHASSGSSSVLQDSISPHNDVCMYVCMYVCM